MPAIEADHHHVYPPGTVHVTVANLDDATVDLDTAVATLEAVPPPAPMFEISGTGCSPDTVFLRCIHDRAFGLLRESLRDAFGVRRRAGPMAWLFDRLSFANVVRFDGRGVWVPIPDVHASVSCGELEIVRTDRYLSDQGTEVLRRIPLEPPRQLA